MGVSGGGSLSGVPQYISAMFSISFDFPLYLATVCQNGEKKKHIIINYYLHIFLSDILKQKNICGTNTYTTSKN